MLPTVLLAIARLTPNGIIAPTVVKGGRMEKVKTERELGFNEPEVGYKWDAGSTPPGDKAPGRWAVRRYPDHWVVLFHSVDGPEYIIHDFEPTEEGERAAKIMALKLVDIAWGREPREE